MNIRFKPFTVRNKTYYIQDPEGEVSVEPERVAFSGVFWEDHYAEEKKKIPLFFIRDAK